MSLFENDLYQWRETYFVLFEQSTRPQAEAVAAAFKAQDSHYEVTDLVANDAGQLESLTLRSRVVTLVMAFLALGLAMIVSVISPDRTVFWFSIFGWSGIAATFVPAIILSLFWDGFSYRGVVASMITGFLSIPLFKFGLSALPMVGEYVALVGEMAPSVGLALIAGYVFSERSGARASD